MTKDEIDLISKYIERIKIDFPEDDKLFIDLKEYAEAYHKERSGWINVKDRLPDEFENIIVWNGEYVYDDVRIINNGEYWTHVSGYDYDSYRINGVTHWQPLPAPPSND